MCGVRPKPKQQRRGFGMCVSRRSVLWLPTQHHRGWNTVPRRSQRLRPGLRRAAALSERHLLCALRPLSPVQRKRVVNPRRRVRDGVRVRGWLYFVSQSFSLGARTVFGVVSLWRYLLIIRRLLFVMILLLIIVLLRLLCVGVGVVVGVVVVLLVLFVLWLLL